MPAYARSQIVEPAVVGIYHCVNRCVRRAFLCGEDAHAGRSFEHRREWIRQRLETLAGLFAVEVLGFCVMANHLHVILRIRPDLARQWDDEAVARRWWQLFPQRRDDRGEPLPPEAHDLRAFMADPMFLAERRSRLACLSWFMRCLSEPIARRANREDGCTGRFWEGRFKSQALLDEAAVLAGSIYVDLNPIRAGIAATPETSEFTGAFERIVARQAEQAEIAAADGMGPVALPHQATDASRRSPADARAGWLSPIELIETPGTETPGTETPGTLASSDLSGDVRKKIEAPSGDFPRRASDQGFLPLLRDDYLQLLDWTGRQMRHGKSGTIPSQLAPILERLHVNAANWCDTVTQFGRWFHRAVGSAANLRRFAQHRGRRWLHGVSRGELAFGA